MKDQRHSELPEESRQPIVAFLLSAYERKFATGDELILFLFKALVTANLGGIGVVVSFGVVMFEKTASLSELFWPSLLFLAGTIAASLAAFVYSVVAVEAAEHMATSVESFLFDEKTLGEMQGYGLSPKGRRIIVVSTLLSIVFWVSAVVGLFGALTLT